MGIVLLLRMVMLLYLLLMSLSALNTVVSREAACGGGTAPSPAPPPGCHHQPPHHRPATMSDRMRDSSRWIRRGMKKSSLIRRHSSSRRNRQYKEPHTRNQPLHVLAFPASLLLFFSFSLALPSLVRPVRSMKKWLSYLVPCREPR